MMPAYPDPHDPARSAPLLRGRLVAAGLMLLLCASAASAFDGRQHQVLTFIAAKHFNRCVTGTDVPLLTPLQVRYMARANAGLAERSMFARMFNWRYYNPDDQEEQSALWVVDTRFHEHFNEIATRMEGAEDEVQAYQDLGRLINYVQLVSSPAHAVPVYTSRFWRLSFGDRFDGYRVDEDALVAALGDDCSFVDDPPASFADALRSSAEDTLAALRLPIPGMPASWEAFWSLPRRPGDFGDYGAAGNTFGRETRFRCGQQARCVLLKDDPLYAEFALARHLTAVRGTLQAMMLMQTSTREVLARAE